jgi:cytochrome c oxidase cbb3-type subunit 3
MAVEERDPHSGYLMTGHEWNGIKELNTPVPRAVYFFLALAFVFSVVLWVLMPAFPTGTSFTKGLLGTDQRLLVADDLKQAAAGRASWASRVETEDFAAIQGDPQLMAFVRETGRTLFGDNCAACHGRAAQGGKGFPILTTSAWLWGGDPAAIAETIRVGINSSHPDTRVSQMVPFGREGMIPRDDVENVVAYVRSLSNHADLPVDKVAAGKEVFAANCASCHGENGAGKTDFGAPDLTDAFWIYGGDAQSVFSTVWNGRQGHMPTWETRLSALDRKILALYLVDLRKPDQ